MFRKCIILFPMDRLHFKITQLDSNRLCVEVYYMVGEIPTEMLGILYFEKAKKSFNRKPVGMDAWACVDAKIEGLYTKDQGITPKMIVQRCYELIKDGGY